MQGFITLLALAGACVAPLTQGAMIPTRVSTSETVPRISNLLEQGAVAAPSPQLRQTNRKAIQIRNVIRSDPLYKRQQASPRAYPTCSDGPIAAVAVARYEGAEMVGGEAPVDYRDLIQVIYVQEEQQCFEVSLELPFVMGYFWSASEYACYLKYNLAPETWTSTSDAAQAPGSATVFYGDCNSFAGSIPGQVQNTCCNTPAIQPVKRRDSVSTDVSVARLSNLHVYGFDIDGGYKHVEHEAACITACSETAECGAYQYVPGVPSENENRCWLKRSGWTSSNVLANSAIAVSSGSAFGVIRSTCDDLKDRLNSEHFRRCRNNGEGLPSL